MKLLTAVLFLWSVGASYSNTVNLNEAVDLLLVGLRQGIIAEGKDQVTLPNIDKEWDEKIARFIRVECKFTCDGGWVGRFSTLKRTGDVTMTTSGNKATLKFKMGFGELTGNYETCRFHAKRIGSMSTKLELSIFDTSIDAQVMLTHDTNSCKLSVDHIFVDNIGKIKVDSGGGVFRKMESKILELIADHWKDKGKDKINEFLQSLASKAASKGDKICSKIPF